MKKKIVTVIASILKPIDDTRMYEKFGISLQQSNNYEVNIIGFSTKNKNLHQDIRFYPLYHFSRLSLARLLAPLRFFRLIAAIQPDLLIITTHELILPAIFYKLLKPASVITYDVQENYYRNVLWQGSFPRWMRFLIGGWIRAKEKISASFFSRFFLAEQGYTKEISFSNSKETTILNKYKSFPKDKHITSPSLFSSADSIKLLYSGTIHAVYGILKSLELAKELSKYLAFQYLVIGHVTQPELLKKLVSFQESYPWLLLHIDTDPVPHRYILQAIGECDFGIVAHQPIPSIANCFPTRIYEFMAFQKPILLQDHQPWTSFCERWDSCLPLDFNNFDTASVATQILNREFYKFGRPDDIFWDSEEKKLLESLHRIFEFDHEQS